MRHLKSMICASVPLVASVPPSAWRACPGNGTALDSPGLDRRARVDADVEGLVLWEDERHGLLVSSPFFKLAPRAPLTSPARPALPARRRWPRRMPRRPADARYRRATATGAVPFAAPGTR